MWREFSSKNTHKLLERKEREKKREKRRERKEERERRESSASKKKRKKKDEKNSLPSAFCFCCLLFESKKIKEKEQV